MDLYPDFSEFIGSLNGADVRYLVVGGYAVAAHGHPRYTGDLDIWVWIDPGNARGVLAALEQFGFGDIGISTSDLMTPDRVVQIGYPPVRIDLLTSIDGVDFQVCYERRLDVEMGAVMVPVISLEDLRLNKRASGRAQDLADLEALEGL